MKVSAQREKYVKKVLEDNPQLRLSCADVVELLQVTCDCCVACDM